MTGMNGVELQEKLVGRGVIVPFIIVTAYGSVKTAVRAMQEGAVVFLEKPCPDETLWPSVLRALDWSERHKRALETRRRIARLTDSERAVLVRIVDGKANKEIQRELEIGLRTVELRRAKVMKAIGAHNIAELVRLTFEAEQIRPSYQRPHFDLATRPAKDQRDPNRPSKRVKR
jgi:FixJ family two-component response regulator